MGGRCDPFRATSASLHWYIHCFTMLAPRAGKRLRPAGTGGYSEINRMLLRALLAAVMVSLLATSAYADVRSQSKSQVEFGILNAQNGLWKEATYRWQKAVELDPTYAAAWNNLAIGYEHAGKFEQARQAYEKAAALDPKNAMIKQNYDLFKEINDRSKRRNGR